MKTLIILGTLLISIQIFAKSKGFTVTCRPHVTIDFHTNNGRFTLKEYGKIKAKGSYQEDYQDDAIEYLLNVNLDSGVRKIYVKIDDDKTVAFYAEYYFKFAKGHCLVQKLK